MKSEFLYNADGIGSGCHSGCLEEHNGMLYAAWYGYKEKEYDRGQVCLSTYDSVQGKWSKSVKLKKETKITDKKTGAVIFHIDDEPDIGETVKEILESLGHHVTFFLSGEEMLKHLKPGKVDIIISDYNMPSMSGNEVISKVKKIDPDVPTILLSGFLDQQVCIDAVNNGAFALLEKPMNFNIMNSTITNALNTVKYSRLLGRSIKLLMYQFSDLNEFLASEGKSHIIDSIRTEMENLIFERNAIREIQVKNKSTG
jgi:FixJ family two-component response regulator